MTEHQNDDNDLLFLKLVREKLKYFRVAAKAYSGTPVEEKKTFVVSNENEFELSCFAAFKGETNSERLTAIAEGQVEGVYTSTMEMWREVFEHQLQVFSAALTLYKDRMGRAPKNDVRVLSAMPVSHFETLYRQLEQERDTCFRNLPRYNSFLEQAWNGTFDKPEKLNEDITAGLALLTSHCRNVDEVVEKVDQSVATKKKEKQDLRLFWIGIVVALAGSWIVQSAWQWIASEWHKAHPGQKGTASQISEGSVSASASTPTARSLEAATSPTDSR